MSNLASTSRAQLASIKETTFGVTPVAGNGVRKRMTGESLDFALTKEESQEIRDDRQVDGAVTVDAAASGAVNIHWQYGEYDDWLEGLYMNPYAVFGTGGVSAAMTVDFTATTITASVATTGANDLSTLQLGQWFRVNAPANANDGKYFRVSLVTPPTDTVVTLHTSTPATVGAAVANVTISTSRISNGVTESSFTLEKRFSDVGQYMAYRGMYPSQLALNIQAGALTNGNFNFMGRDMVRGTATTLPGTLGASKTYDIQNGVRGVSQIWEGGAPLTDTFIRSLSLNYDNTLRAQTAISNRGAVGIGVGDVNVSGSMEVYFKDGNLLDKFLNDTYTSITVGTRDTAGNAYIFTMPRVMLMSCQVSAGSKNQDVMATFNYKAFRDGANAVPDLQKTIIMDRVGAALT